MYCRNCGCEIDNDSLFCRYCGKKIESKYNSKSDEDDYSYDKEAEVIDDGVKKETPKTNGKSRITAAMLALFVGGIGIQHFYLGNISKGVLSIVFSWTYIPAIIGVIDFIRFLTMSDDEFNLKYPL